jgi:hypothetical protein
MGAENESGAYVPYTLRRPTTFAAPSLPLYAGTARRFAPPLACILHIRDQGFLLLSQLRYRRAKEKTAISEASRPITIATVVQSI